MHVQFFTEGIKNVNLDTLTTELRHYTKKGLFKFEFIGFRAVEVLFDIELIHIERITFILQKYHIDFIVRGGETCNA